MPDRNNDPDGNEAQDNLNQPAESPQNDPEYEDPEYDDDPEEEEPSFHPAAITGPIHAAVLITNLLQTAQAATSNAAKYQQSGDLYLAAANTECAAEYLYVAEPIIRPSGTPGEILQTFEETTENLLDIEAKILSQAEPTPLYEETVACLQTQQQAILNLERLEEIKTILDASGQQIPVRYEEFHEAHVSVAQYFGYQPPFTEVRDPKGPRPELAQKAEHARAKGQELADSIMADYEKNLPTQISPGTAGLHSLKIHPYDTPQSPAVPQFGLHMENTSSQQEPGPHPENEHDQRPCTPYMTFIHMGVKHVKTINEPYPKEFPQQLAISYAQMARNVFEHMVFMDEPMTTPVDQHNLLQKIEDMEDAAELGIQDTTPQDFRAIIKTAKDANLPPGARTAIIDAITQNQTGLADTILDDPNGHWRKSARKQQARKVMSAARSQKIDVYTLAEIAEAMGYKPQELGITRPTLSHQQLQAVVDAMEDAGLPHEAIAQTIEEFI